MGGPKFGICLCIDVVLHFVIQTNMLLQLGQIHLAIWTNTFVLAIPWPAIQGHRRNHVQIISLKVISTTQLMKSQEPGGIFHPFH